MRQLQREAFDILRADAPCKIETHIVNCYMELIADHSLLIEAISRGIVSRQRPVPCGNKALYNVLVGRSHETKRPFMNLNGRIRVGDLISLDVDVIGVQNEGHRLRGALRLKVSIITVIVTPALTLTVTLTLTFDLYVCRSPRNCTSSE